MQQKKKKSRWKTGLAVVLLAGACLIGVELAVCRVADPALYEKLTAPVRAACGKVVSAGAQAVQAIGGAIGGVADAVSGAASDLFAPAEEPVESQAATEPTEQEALKLADPELTRLTQRDGVDILTGGSVDMVYYQQSAPAWADKAYGRDKIGGYGCGPTAMAMVVSSLTAQSVNPEQMAKWAADNGYWASRSGSRHSIVPGAAKAYGLTASAFRQMEPDAMLRQLAEGNVFVALMTKGHFTQSGHFIVIRGATLSGTVLVADPNSPERSQAEWDPQLILNELSKSQDSGAPLWLIENPNTRLG